MEQEMYSSTEAAEMAGYTGERARDKFLMATRRLKLSPVDEKTRNGGGGMKVKHWSMEQIEKVKASRKKLKKKSTPDTTPADDSGTDKKIMPVDAATSTLENAINNCGDIVSRKAELVQQLENLPQEILSLRRFLETRKDNPKRPVISDWQNPKNQKLYSELKGIVGFVAATEQAGGLVMYDFDHCRNPDGSFVNEDAERWFNYLHAEEYFCESSKSDEGLHMFGQPTTGKFGRINLRLYFTEDKKSYLEVFYSSTRFCLCTGKPFRCKPNAPIAQGEVADEQLQTILGEIQRRTPLTIQEPKKASHEFSTTDAAFDSFRLERMLVVIPPEDLSFNDWLTALSCCFNLGMSYANFDAWCRRDTKKNPKGEPRYNELENRNHWANRIDPAFGFGQLYNIAIRYGYDAKQVTKEYYDIHPAEQPARADDGERTQDKISSCPVNLLIPADYDFNFHGITYLQPSRRDDGKIRRVPVTRTPIIPTRKFRNPMTGKVAYEFAIFTDGEWQTVEIDGGALADTRDTKKALGEKGALIDEPNILSKYINATLALNSADLPKIKSYNQTGWTDDDCEEFAYPTSPDYVIRREGHDYGRTFKPKGDADKWREKFSEVMKQGEEIAHVVMGTAAAAFLVRPFGLPNLQVHLHGKRSIGKTPLLRFVVSAFGFTGKKGLYYTFGATSPKSRLEIESAFRDLPIIGEEIESLSKRDAENLAAETYNYSLGIGGQVLTKNGDLRDAKEISGALLTDGEHERTTTNGNGGELKRVLQLRATELLDEKFASDLHGFCDRNHGLFLEQWIRYIKAHRDEIARDFHEALGIAKHMQKRGERQTDSTQLTTLIISIVAYQHFKVCIGLQDAVDLAEQGRDRIAIVAKLPNAEDIDDVTRAIEFLGDFIAGHERYFYRLDEKAEHFGSFTNEQYGLKLKDTEYAFIPTQLTNILENAGFTSGKKLIAEFLD
ncbi:MAG: DUF927 domain-containing protein, partial [Selenomonadaceae bacterium]|nr:DUF927 domain-containing protein [Selenomonadaceae bacterium]